MIQTTALTAEQEWTVKRMDDLIKRKDAIDALGEEPLVWDEWTDEYNLGMQTLWVVAKRDIESLPSVDAVPQWIPCEERLPKPFEYCLFTTTDGEVVYRHWDGMASRYKAWMPLPKPYERKEE